MPLSEARVKELKLQLDRVTKAYDEAEKELELTARSIVELGKTYRGHK